MKHPKILKPAHLFHYVCLLSVSASLSVGCGDEDSAGSMCTDTCVDAFDGYCDDGAPDSDFSICELGTDCGDCGPRSGAGEGSQTFPPQPTLQACYYTYRSRLACPGSPNSFSGPDERCSMVESLQACRNRFESDTDCFSSCCSSTTISGHRLEPGTCR